MRNAAIERLLQIRRLIPALLLAYWVLIFTGTHVPLEHVGGMGHNRDKVLHFVAYAGLAWLLGVWFWARGRSGLRTSLLIFAIAAIYGGADELLQIPVGRNADVLDWLADCSGAAAGLVMLALTQAVWRVARSRPATYAVMPVRATVDAD